MSATFDRQIRPIYDAIDTGSNKSAIVACNKLLKKQPQNDLVKALKALALVRSQKVEESLIICDEVLASKPTDESVLGAMGHVLRGLGRHLDIITMYDTAWKQQPGNEELGIHTFSANARAGNWKAAQQVATKLHKQFKEERFLYWSIFCALLQANDPLTPTALRPVLYKLAHRLITSTPTPSFYSADRFYVHLTILKELELWDDATTLLSTEIGEMIANTSLAVDELRRDIWKLKGSMKEEGESARIKILEKNDRNWLEFLSVLDAAFWDLTSTPEPSEEAREQTRHSVTKAQELFARISDKDGLRDRSGPLALLELEKRALDHGLSTDSDALYTMVETYFQNFGDKMCCYEDLLPYVPLFSGNDLTNWTAFLEKNAVTSYDTQQSLRRSINAFKLLRYTAPSASLTVDSEAARTKQYAAAYFNGLKFGEGLAETELQPADDLAILAAQALVSLWKLTDGPAGLQYLFNATALLEFGLSKSKESYQIKILLTRIYQIIGAPSLAVEQYRALNLRQVQTDTLSHLLLSRASIYALSSIGDLTYSNECMEASQIYVSNATETAEYVVRAFMGEKYSQIPEFCTLEDHLENSLQRDLMKMEHVRMRMAHEIINTDLVDMELIELKFIFDRLHHDNRDFAIIPNYQPRDGPSFSEQTTLFDKTPHQGWLSSFLKIYIRALQQASDLDDTVEDKLLIGDRPKPHAGVDLPPIRDRVAQHSQDELDELTSDELNLYEWAQALGDWVEPHHDYVRPPPSAVMSEVARLTEQKTGQPPKGLIIPPNGESDGHKKDEEPPAVKEAPEAVTKFFNDMRNRFQTALRSSAIPPELLQIVALTQEAYLLLTVVTSRFKSSAIVKQHKLGQLVQSLKDIRLNASDILLEFSAELKKLAHAETDSASRTAFVDACTLLVGSSELDSEFVLGVAKKVCDARKAIYEGISTGVTKVSKAYT